MRFEVIKKPKYSRQGMMSERQHCCVVRKIPFRAQNGGVCYLYHGASEAELWDKKKRAEQGFGKGNEAARWVLPAPAAAPADSCPCSLWAPLMSLQHGMHFPLEMEISWKIHSKSEYFLHGNVSKRAGREREFFICTAPHSGLSFGVKAPKKNC